MPGEVEMSLADFHTQLQRHRREIKDTWDSAFPVYEQFAQEEDIYPEHCDQVRNAIHKMRIPVRSFYHVLGTPAYLPLAIVSHSFSPVTILHQVDDLTDELMIRIVLFRKICHLPSQNREERHREILQKLFTLAQGYDDIIQHVDRLLLQVLMQEKAERQKLKSAIYSS
jgi:hypothetical protein